MANLVQLVESLLTASSDQTVPTGTCSPPHQETHLYQTLDQDQKVLVQPVYSTPNSPCYFGELLAGLDALEQVEDYKEFLESQNNRGPYIYSGRRIDGEEFSCQDSDARQCTEESKRASPTLRDFNASSAPEPIDEDNLLEQIMQTEETAEVKTTAAELFAKIQNYDDEDSSWDGASDTSGNAPSSQSSDDSEWMSLGIKNEVPSDGVESDTDMQELCMDLGMDRASQALEAENVVMTSYISNFVMEQESENTAMYEREPGKGFPKFHELLGEQTTIKGSPSFPDNNNNTGARIKTVNRRLVAKNRQPWNMQPSPIQSDTSFDDSDDDFYHHPLTTKRCTPNCVAVELDQTPPPNMGKRSRRRSPKLWNFLLDGLCDPSMNPSIISWVNKQRGLFKIEDTKALSNLWGRRVGKTQKEGCQHTMNYEKFSRAMRYYYKGCVLISVPGRLTYQFGPNATGWRARAENECV